MSLPPSERHRGMSRNTRNRRRPPALGPPGLNPLFWGVVLSLACGGVAGALAGDATILHSNLLFRLVVGGAVTAVAYAVVVVLWLAWHRRTLKRFGAAGANAEAPDL